jgi:hypothetical protein
LSQVGSTNGRTIQFSTAPVKSGSTPTWRNIRVCRLTTSFTTWCMCGQAMKTRTGGDRNAVRQMDEAGVLHSRQTSFVEQRH